MLSNALTYVLMAFNSKHKSVILQQTDLYANFIFWWPEFFRLNVDILPATTQTHRQHGALGHLPEQFTGQQPFT